MHGILPSDTVYVQILYFDQLYIVSEYLLLRELYHIDIEIIHIKQSGPFVFNLL